MAHAGEKRPRDAATDDDDDALLLDYGDPYEFSSWMSDDDDAAPSLRAGVNAAASTDVLEEPAALRRAGTAAFRTPEASTAAATARAPTKGHHADSIEQFDSSIIPNHSDEVEAAGDGVVRDETQTAVQELHFALAESNVRALQSCVELLGVSVCRELLQRVKEVEEGGGMMTADGSRRRTRGGVFFHLLRARPDVTPQDVKVIFAHDAVQHNRVRNARKKERLMIMRGVPL